MARGCSPGERRGGRRKGSLNKRKTLYLEARKACEAAGFDPFEQLVVLAKGKNYPADIRLRASKELAEYLGPKLTRSEHSGPGGGPIKHEDVGMDLSKLSTEDILQLRKLREKASSGERE